MSKHSKQWICPCNNITCTQRHTQREQTKTVTLWISLNNYLEILKICHKYKKKTWIEKREYAKKELVGLKKEIVKKKRILWEIKIKLQCRKKGIGDFLGGSVVKNTPCKTGNTGSIPCWKLRSHLWRSNWHPHCSEKPRQLNDRSLCHSWDLIQPR